MGGFHPDYRPPAYLGLPSMKRMTVNILSGTPSLVFTAYFAITTNTVQFGAEVRLRAEIAGCGIVGELGFDVLFQFDPFHFKAAVRASLEVKVFGCTLCGVSLSGSLEGPAPWRIEGRAKVKVLFFSVSIKVSKTFGEKKEISLPGIDVLPLVLQAFRDPANWRSECLAGRFEPVTMRDLNALEQVVISAASELIINQNLVPLDREISKYGNYRPTGTPLFNAADVRIGSKSLPATPPATNFFAPDSYQVLEDADKLAAASFEELPSGLRISGQDNRLDGGYFVNRVVEYEVVTSDYEPEDVQDETTVAPYKWPGYHATSENLLSPFVRGHCPRAAGTAAPPSGGAGGSARLLRRGSLSHCLQRQSGSRRGHLRATYPGRS
ncbi:MAG: hypothetical protein D6722_05910 [Bacteroidetes bacterium]|nr:MAG: hypothetical protein D6722_05910 [Bacteroidota bacterium]